ncbi:asparagine synthase-related protein [Streptomyces carpinensis]|uniref:asparagine synthase (glutamine-hydrolyzing) n=1 Tax=Streptomyces carpinensis TaxID=66369 RepID=A0ABV1W6H0_9ACTN|nr:asparagine synthase-related protein [Streptomyces carpinensis]
MEALRLEWAGGTLRLWIDEAMERQGLVTTVSSRAGAAAVVGWAGSVRDRVTGVRGLLDDFARQGSAPPLPAGDYAAVLVCRDRILMMRDEQARVPLFFRESGGRVRAVSTSARSLGSVTELERDYFCRYLTGNMAQQHWDITPFAEVHRVLGGEVVELSLTGRMRSRVLRGGRHYDSPVATADGARPHLREAAKDLRLVLEHAVGRRMGTLTACHVSGGTDSTSVALLAARLLAAGRVSAGELLLLSGRFSGGELAGERPYLDAALEEISRQTPMARPVIVDADDVTDFDDFQHHAGDADEPYAHAFRAPFWARLHAAAAELGCDTLLTGCGADPVVDANPFHLHRLARTGRLRQLTKQARAWAACSERGSRDIFHAYVVQPALPLATERITALARSGTVLGGLGNFNRPRWLRSGFARTHGYRSASIAESRFVFGRKPEQSLYDAANYLAAPDPLSWHRARLDGFFLSHPFLDPEVVAMMRRLPVDATFHASRPKEVLREAMADLLPARIRGRAVKIPFNDLYVRGLRRHCDELIDLCRSARHPLIAEMFDVETLCQAVREAQLGTGDAYACDRVNSSLALVMWLERLDERSSALSPAVPVIAGS